MFLFVHTSLCVRLFFLLACASALGSVFACLVFGGEPVLPPRLSFGLGQVGAFGVLESVPFLRWAVRGAVCACAEYTTKID